MAHEFESGFFVQQPAWHQLGKVLDNPPTTEQAIIEAGLDWKVLEEPIYRIEKDGLVRIPTHKSLVRDRDRKLLGVVSNAYHPLQNSEAFKWFDILLHEGEVTLEAAGSLKRGKRIWILAKIHMNPVEIQAGDAIQPYLLLHNSHDGSTAIWIQFTPIRVVCWNTLSWAAASRYEDEKNRKAFRIRHNSNIEEKLALAQQALDLARQTFDTAIDDYKAMAFKPITKELFELYLANIFELETPRDNKAFPLIQENFEAGRGNQGKSLWDAYNGFTEWLDHQRGKSEVSRLESAWFGDSARLRIKAHREALALL
jgi:phage/plasmid-like protein (TIGR03299 family)